jgi:hypothetical protein
VEPHPVASLDLGHGDESRSLLDYGGRDTGR